jgi:hypothetical protein
LLGYCIILDFWENSIYLSYALTLVSYADRLDIGIIACRRSLPSIQRLIDCLEEALCELEELAGL